MMMKSDVGKSGSMDHEDQHRSYQIELLNRDTGQIEAKVVDLDQEFHQIPVKLKGHLSREAKDFVRRSGMAHENIEVSIKQLESPSVKMGREIWSNKERVKSR